MSLKFNVGEFTVHRIIEQETTFLQANDALPTLTPEVLAENREWLQKTGALDANDTLILCFQSYIIKTPHHTILIDTCIGNDKPRPLRPKWNMKTDDAYMRALAASGFSVGDIDFVMCTHLHVDHVGWNTRLENGLWVPTFPNARYLMSELDVAYYGNLPAEHPQYALTRECYDDSILPVLNSGQAELVRTGHVVEREIGNGVWMEGCPGHTPGTMAIHAQCGHSHKHAI